MKHRAMMVGKSHCIAASLAKSPYLESLDVLSDFVNPGLVAAARDHKVIKAKTADRLVVAEYAKKLQPTFAIIGSEEPLANGVVDELRKIGIPCVGPTQNLAKLESSKSFTRELLTKYGIPGNPEYKVFRSLDGMEAYLTSKKTFVVKPDGLTGGKGVQVFGDHFNTVAEALAYCRELFDGGQPRIVIEEKLDGEEFSFQSFFDGQHIAHTIPIQDHKRAFDNDTGPNTGGMGSYSCSDHLLPFLSAQDIADAGEINRQVGEALLKETGEEYKGILYGGFMLTKDGLRVIEYNSRFGDPEVMNVLSLLETDFVEICDAIIKGELDRIEVTFRREATVCKYVVPKGYPKEHTAVGQEIDLSAVLASPDLGDQLRMYYAAVNEDSGSIRLTDSRSVAFVGIADTLAEAEKIAERAAASVKGPVSYRQDIGTDKLIKKRKDHMNRIRSQGESLRRRVG